MREYFDNIPLDDEEKLSEKRINNIKTSVLSRVKEEKAMSKRTTIRTITIAVAAATTAALSAIIASAEQSAWTPATDVEEAQAPETIAPEIAENENKQDEPRIDEKPCDRIVTSTEGDYISVHVLSDDGKEVYYYYKMPDDKLEEMLSNGWTLIDEDVNTIHENEVFVTE
ncbi:MAG: hypothetical protein K2J77_00310 [Oscillospiraceae bacterium]|nr:hypothetical protein [Oscillospiraceae bacterium]